MLKEKVYKANLVGSISKNTIVVPNPIFIAAQEFIGKYSLGRGCTFDIEDEEGNKFRFETMLLPVHIGEGE